MKPSAYELVTVLLTKLASERAALQETVDHPRTIEDAYNRDGYKGLLAAMDAMKKMIEDSYHELKGEKA